MRTKPLRSLAITSMRLGPSCSRSDWGVSKFPLSSTLASNPLTLTVASGDDLPTTEISEALTTLLSSGDDTSRESSLDCGIGVAEGVGVGASVGVPVGAGVGVGEGEGVGTIVCVGAGILVGVGAMGGVDKGVGVRVGAIVGVGVGVEVGVGMIVGVGVDVGEGVDVGTSVGEGPAQATIKTTNTQSPTNHPEGRTLLQRLEMPPCPLPPSPVRPGLERGDRERDSPGNGEFANVPQRCLDFKGMALSLGSLINLPPGSGLPLYPGQFGGDAPAEMNTLSHNSICAIGLNSRGNVES